MSVTIRRPKTLADVLRRLGNIPPSRILWNPLPGTATEADQLRYLSGDKKRLVELIDGVLVEKAMGYREGIVALLLGTILNNFVRPRQLGIIAGADAIMRLAPGRNRIPDLSFTAWASLPTGTSHLVAIADYAPDLAIEILSPSNTRREMARKRREYFRRGTKLVWIVDPTARTIAVYTDPRTHTLLGETDTLTGGDVLPGFTLLLAELFNDPQLNPAPTSTP